MPVLNPLPDGLGSVGPSRKRVKNLYVGSFLSHGFDIDAKVRVDAQTAVQRYGDFAGTQIRVKVPRHNRLSRDHAGLPAFPSIGKNESVDALVSLVHFEFSPSRGLLSQALQGSWRASSENGGRKHRGEKSSQSSSSRCKWPNPTATT